jgi:hypothetical protein
MQHSCEKKNAQTVWEESTYHPVTSLPGTFNLLNLVSTQRSCENEMLKQDGLNFCLVVPLFKHLSTLTISSSVKTTFPRMSERYPDISMGFENFFDVTAGPADVRKPKFECGGHRSQPELKNCTILD